MKIDYEVRQGKLFYLKKKKNTAADGFNIV